MKDYYKILGVDKSASASDIKQAFRRLAMEHHPDRGGDVTRFQEIQEAYSVLGDEQKRRQYDTPQPKIDINFGGVGTPFDINSIFEMFGADIRRQQRRTNPRISIGITLGDVIKGGPRTLNVQFDNTNSVIEIDIPPGIHDNDNIRYPGLGPGGLDLIVNYRIIPDAAWQREGNNLLTHHRISVWDMVTGCELPVTDPAGNRYILQVPPESQPGTMLRLKQKGIPPRQLPVDRSSQIPGDILVRLDGFIPTPVDTEIVAAIRKTKGQ